VMAWTFRRTALHVLVACVLAFGGAGAGFGQIVINEVMYDPSISGDVNGEWFELYNAGATAVDINGWIIKDDTSTSETHTISNTGGLSIAAGGYLVLGRNSNTSLNGNVTVDYVYSSVSLSNSTDGLILTNAADVEQDKVIWGTANSFPDPSNSASIALKFKRGTSPLDNLQGANWCISTMPIPGGVDAGTPGAANTDCEITPAFTGEIFGIQGDGATSPHVRAESVTTNDNIVTAVGAGGFFMQTPASRSDNDPDTSDGIFVVHAGAPTVTVGDQVDVSGTVEEYFGFTRFASGATVTLDASNQPLPDFVEFDASRPAPNPARANCAMEPECYEGMRIRIASGTVTTGSQYFGSDNVAEMYVRPGDGRAFREPGARYPGVSGRPTIPVWDGNPEVFELDPDKLGLDNVSWAPGSTFSAAGVLGYEFGGYELWATELRARTGGITLPQAVRSKAQGEVTVASLNLLNLRENDADLKYEKLSLYIREVLGSPDVIGVQEAYQQAALAKLATRISTDDSSVVYTAHVVQTTNRQAVGYLVLSGVTVGMGSPTEHGAGETFVDPRDNSNDAVHDRLPLMLQASVGDFAFTVINIHNRSFIDIDDTARGAWVRAKRLAQAQSVARLVQQQNNAGSKVIVVGDFNDYQFTDGYVDVVGQIKGSLRPSRNLLSGPDLVNPNLCNLVDGLPAADQYSLLFQGSAQALDHALVNRPMSRHAVEMQYGRGNADAAGVERNNANALASSDHDGLVVYLSTADRGRSNCPAGQEDGPDGGGLPPPDVLEADLSLRAEGHVISSRLVRYDVSVRNAGPDEARNVRVTSTLTASGDLEASTTGCEEDPDGVPTCSLDSVKVGESVSFMIEIVLDGRSGNFLRYRGVVNSSARDPNPDDDESETSTPLRAPPAPTELVATALNETEIELRWRDNSRTETAFAVFLQGPGDSKLRLIETVPANTTSTVVTELVPNVTYSFAVEARNGELRSGRTQIATATTWAEANLNIDVEGRVLSEELVRYTVSVRNAGPDDAQSVVVSSSLTAAEGSFGTSTSGCLEDPRGMPECRLGDIDVAESDSFTIDVRIDAAAWNSLTYTGVVRDIADPRPQEDRIEITLPLGRPEAPSGLAVTSLSGTEVELRWRDNSRTETEFAVSQQGPGDSKLRLIGTVPANTTSMVATELAPSVTYAFAVEARNGLLRSERTPGATATTRAEAALRIDAEGVIVSEELVRYTVSVSNAGPRDAQTVVVSSSLTAAEGSFATSTSGCREDPGGVPQCSVDDIDVGETSSFTIDIRIDATSRTNSLTYSGAIAAAPGTDSHKVEVTLPLGYPASPSGLAATALSGTEVELRWRDNSDRETGFGVFLQGPGDSKLRLIGTVPANTTSMVATELAPSVTYAFAVEARNGLLRSERTPGATATTRAEAALRIDAEGVIVSEELVRYTVSVSNAGPRDAQTVVVSSSLTAAEGSFATSTSGCREDPGGVPQCSVDDIDVGETSSFTIDIRIDATSRTNSLTYSGAIAAAPGTDSHKVEVTLPLGYPASPSGLAATALSGTEVELRWRDNSDRETGFGVFLQGPGDSKLRLIGTVPANTTSMVVNELVPSITYSFAVEAQNGELRSERTPKAEATTWVVDAARCGEDDALCVGAFQVEVEWDDGKGRVGRGIAERLTADAGDFWFFHPTNIELVVKVLDGCAINDHYWVYAAGLTDVGVTMTVRDLRSGAEKSWTNPLGTRFRPITDPEAFATCDDASRWQRGNRVVLSGAPRGRAKEFYAAALSTADLIHSARSACAADDASLCLLDSSFEVRADWEAGGRNGAAAAIPRTTDTGMFWFFSSDNVELVVKVLDGCRENGYRWVLMGGLTDVGVEVTVTDSESGRARMYRNLEGTPFPAMFDLTAFACDARQ